MFKNGIGWIILGVILISIGLFIPFYIGTASIEEEMTSSEVTIEISDFVSEESEHICPEVSIPEVETMVPASLSYERLIEGDLIAFTKELEYCEAQSDVALESYNQLISLGYDSNDDILLCLEQDAVVFLEHANYYAQIIQEKYAVRYPSSALEQYPAATYIWGFMKDQGWSDIVCAGIMGNIMQETGGRTLDIDYMHSNNYYGMCCWKKEYHPEVVDADLQGQCEYLLKTMVSCFNQDGFLYEEGYTFQDFLEAETIEEAAGAFMIVYERPGHTNPIKRTENGQKAYDYFIGLNQMVM